MKTSKSARIRKLIITLLPLSLLLAACESVTTIEFNSDGVPTITAQIKDDSGVLGAIGIKSCKDLLDNEAMAESLKLNGKSDYSTNSVDKSTEKTLDCTLTVKGKRSAINGDTLKVEDNKLIFTSPKNEYSDLNPENLGKIGIKDANVSFTVVMPGKIISAEGAKIEGNRATYDLLNLSKGIKVVGEKNKSLGSTLTSSTAGIPTFIWIIVAVAGVLVIATIGLLVAKKRKDAAPAPEAATAPAPEAATVPTPEVTTVPAPETATPTPPEPEA